MKIENERKETLARQLESQGYSVIRAFKHHYPDVIAFKRGPGIDVMAVTVKPQNTDPTELELTIKAELESAGIDACFKYVQDRESRVKRMSKVEWSLFELEAFTAGENAFKAGLAEKDWPRHPDKYKLAWYKQKFAWLDGYRTAQAKEKTQLERG